MAQQKAQGTITIIDTNDIERIYTVYAKSANNATVPSAAAANWSENVSTAPGTGNYIWQRTVVEKSGTGEKTYSDPVCLTGEEGESAKNIIAIETQYGISANWNTEPSSWSADTPSYDSSKPDYWVRNRLKYEDNTYSNWVVNKDYALTQAVYNAAIANSIAQSANENANGAMGQAAANVQSITRLWYATSTHTKPSAPSSEITSGSAGTYGSWSTVKPTATNTYRYFYYCDQSKTGGGVVSWSEVIEDTSYLSTYEINALDVKTRNFFKGKDNTYDGWFASGRASDDGLNEADATTYYYNARFGATHITLGYNKTPVIDLDGGSGAIKLYSLPTINSSTHLVTTAGKLGMQLTSDALSFYGSSTSTPDAQLSSTGLQISNGAIIIGSTSGTSAGNVALSNSDFTRSINGTSRSNLRLAIGQYFGVKNDGTLYATNAVISGQITASSLTIGSGATVSGLSTSNISGINDYALQSSLDTEIAQRKAVYAVSTTGPAVAAKTTESGTPAGFVLYNGATVTVKFNSANSTTTPTLNVNGTGAKTIKSYTGAALTAAEYTWPAGAAITFTYDGSYWRMQDGGTLQAKADAAASASNASGSATAASNSASAASTSATSASNSASSASNSATLASNSASSASSSATTATNQATAAAGSATAASNSATAASGSATAASNSATAASNSATAASDSAIAASNSATAAAEVMGGFTILWNYSAFGTSTAGDAFICGFDPATGTKSDVNGWVKWNSTKRTITKQQVNPGTIVPYNIPIYIVCRLSSATATTGTNYMVWYNAGWKYAACPSPTAVGGSWTWTDNRDIILGSFVETGANEVLTECELFNPPWTSKQITTNTTTPTSYIMDTDSNKGITVKPKDSSGNDFLQMNSTAIEFFRNSTTNSVMRLTDSSFRLGLEASNHTTIDTNGLHIWSGTESTSTNEIALFSTTARIGKSNNSRFLMNATSLQAYNSSNQLYFEVSSSGMTYGNNTVASTAYADQVEANASYSLIVKTTAIDYAANTATLVATPYYQGSTTLPTGVTLAYQWYKDSVSNSSPDNRVGTNSNTLSVTNAMGLDHTYICVISTN